MEIWTAVEIIAGVVAVGISAGIFVGKYLVKRARPDYKPLLSLKEKVIYSACILVGAAFILFGIFYQFPTADNIAMNQDGAAFVEEDTLAGDETQDEGPLQIEEATAIAVAKAA